MNLSENDLTTQLSREAERFDGLGGTTLEIGQVLDRAGAIKRGRRMRASMVMAAVVLAVAVPTTLIVTNGGHDKPVTPSHRAAVDTSPLALAGLREGASPAHGYSADGTWQLPVAANGLSALRGRVADAVAVKDGVMVAMRTGGGEQTAWFIYAQGGTSEQSWPIEGGFAVSDGGTVAAFVEPDGTVVAVQDRGTQSFELGRIPAGSGFSAVGVQGESCSGRSQAASCTVYVTTAGQEPRTYVATPDQEPRELDTGLLAVDDVAADGRVAGMLSATDDGSCSEVLASSLRPVWKTCDHQLGSFSPDGEHLSAFPAYVDGAGSSELAVLDARTGAVVLDLHTIKDAYVAQVVWEDETHLLAVVGQGSRAAILRIGLDGSREYAVPPTEGEPYVPPFVLPRV